MNKIQVYIIYEPFLTEEVPVRFYEFLNTENITARIIVIKILYRVSVMVFNTTVNNISAISWWYYWWKKPEFPVKTIDLP